MLDIDSNCSWVPQLTNAIGTLMSHAARERILAARPELVEDALDLVFSQTKREEIVNATIEWIRTTTVAGYHGTRLIDSEVESIWSCGLLPLEAPARGERLVRTLSQHPKWNPEKLNAALEKYGKNNKAGRRERQVHLTLSRYGLLHDFNHYLTHGAEFDQHVAYCLLGNEGKELLQQDGKARVIKVSVPGNVALKAANRYIPIKDQLLYKGQLHNLVAEFLKAWSYTLAYPDFDCSTLRVDCGMVFFEALPSDWIVDIETL